MADFRFKPQTGRVCKSGDVSPRRIQLLNRRHFDGSLRELTGVEYDFGATLPSDAIAKGFDTIASVLTPSSAYLEPVYRVIEQFHGISDVSLDVDAIDMTPTGGGSAYLTRYWQIPSGGRISSTFTLPSAGNYTLRVRAFVGPTTGPLTLIARVGAQSRPILVQALEALPDVFEADFNAVSNGSNVVSVETQAGAPVFVEYVELRKRTSSQPRLILGCDPYTTGHIACAQYALTQIVTRAWRRPLEPAELDELVGVVAGAMVQEMGFKDSVMIAVQAALFSPNFLYRIELPGGSRRLNNYELASRLSYFLWDRPPDDLILAQASILDYQDEPTLDILLDYMLQSPKFDSMRTFFSQHMQLQALAARPGQTPIDAKTETLTFVENLYQTNRPLEEIFDARYSYINDHLAQTYEIPGVAGSHFRRVDFPAASPRRGFLTQAGFLMGTASGNLTNPTRLGNLVLSRWLCDGVPTPPAGVGTLVVNPNDPKRLRLQAHASNPACAGCHVKMDPIGLAFEQFPSNATYRLYEITPNMQSHLIDPSGSFGRRSFANHHELIRFVLEEPAYKSCLAEHLVQYSVGREATNADSCDSIRVGSSLVGSNNNLKGLLRGVVKSDAFRSRRD